MKLLESKIFDAVNYLLSFIQNKLDNLRQNSFLLSNIDYFILFFIILTFIASLFCETGMIGMISAFVPFLVVVKVLINKDEKIELELCNFFLLVYFIICFITNFSSSMPIQSFYGFMKTSIYFAFYFALCQFLKNKQTYIYILLVVIAILMGAESIYALAQNTFGLENNATWQDLSYVNPENVLTRVYGTLKPYNPNLFAGYLVSGISSILGVGLILTKAKNYKLGLPYIFLFLVSLLAVFLTGCRGAYISLFIIVLGIMLASYQVVFNDFNTDKIKKIWQGFVASCSAFFVMFLAFNHSILQRLLSIFILRADSSTSFRMNVYNSSIQMFQDNWLFGIGVGNKVFREIYGLYMLSGFDALSTYCVFLEIAVESGIFALLAYVLFIGSLVFMAIKSFINSKDFNYKVVLFVCIISILAVMFHGLFDTVYFRPQIQYIFWTMCAILVSMLKK